jgi:PAS domain S-box-containing protein
MAQATFVVLFLPFAPLSMSASFALLPVFNALPGAFLLLSPSLVVEAASDDYLAVAMVQRAQLIGRPIFELFPDNPATPEVHGERTLRDSFARVLATGQPHELALQRYDLPDPAAPGQFVERYWLPSNRAVLDEAGRVQHLLHTVVDVTAQVQAAAQLRASEARAQAAHAAAERQRGELQRIFEQAPVAIAVYRGPTHVIELANPLVCALWGRTQAQAVGTPLFELLPEVAGQGYEELLAGVLATGVPHEAREMPSLIDRQGRRDTVYWNFVYLPMREEDGRVSGVMVVAAEVTEQVLAREQVLSLNHQLAAVNAALHASHDELLANQEEVLLVQQRLEHRVAERTQQLAAALQEAEQQRTYATGQQRLLDQILGQVPAAIATVSGPEHRYSFFNDGYQALSGHRTRLGSTVAEVFPEVVAQGFIDLLDQVYATGQPLQGQETPAQLYDRATGQPELRYVDFIYQPLMNAPGHTQGILAFIVDVTDKVRARQHAEALQAQVLAAAQRQAQEREAFYQIFAQTPAAICIQRGPEHRYEYANGPYHAFFPGRQLLGRPVAEALPETVGSGVVALLDNVYRTGETYYGEELPLLIAQPDGQPPRQMFFTFTYQAFRENGEIVGISTFAYDVAEQVLARRQVQQLNEALAAINEELLASNEELNATNTLLTRTNVDLDNFVYTASHDLKAPIANIEGLLLALREHLPAPAPPVPRLLDLMQESAERFRVTIAQLTDIARLQQAHSQPAENVPLAATAEAVGLDLAPLLTAAGAALTIDVAPDLHVSFAPQNLRSLLYNLLSNAVKYRDPARPAEVVLRAARTATGVVLTVQDNGLGLTEAQQNQLFGIFRRLHSHVEGSGVGLHMVKRMVENVGGTITVASQPGVGSTFTVTFPTPN